MYHHFGIDYGSKMAGTTVICYFEQQQFVLLQTNKKQDADAFIFEHCSKTTGTIYIDAPLSLPGIYRGLQGCTDYFYREADKAVQAMSPMFLGGLTARAIQLQAKLAVQNPCVEVYPGGLARTLRLSELGYKKELNLLPNCLLHTLEQLQLADHLKQAALHIQCDNWHQFDAFLAWCIGWKLTQKTATAVGSTAEGMIYF